MGGQSTQSATQSSTTAPWDQAQPAIKGMLGQVSSGLNNTGLTGAESGALNTIEANGANATSAYAPQIGSNATYMLNGGGAQAQDPALQAAFKNYFAQTQPLASNTNYDPMSTPGLGTQLQTIQSDVANSVNGQFAAAGRDMSGANQQAYGRGVAQGEAPVITDQYNKNVAAQQAAAAALYGAGNTTAGALDTTNAAANANKQTGTTAAGDAVNASNAGANAALQAEAQRRGIPVQALGMLAQIGIPIAGLGSQSTGQSSGTSNMSGAQQFATIASGIGSMIPKGPMSFSF